MLKPDDIKELQHLRDGGKWCLDGRKERRLKRLGYIELNFGGLGWQTSQLGRDALKIEAAKSETAND